MALNGMKENHKRKKNCALATCRKLFVPVVAWQEYCEDKCGHKARALRYYEKQVHGRN